MCGRYLIAAEIGEFSERFQLRGPIQLPLRLYNIAPRMELPVIFVDGERRAVPMRWGLIPSWTDDPKIGDRLINARAETVGEKPAFRRAFARQRCLVPASGFYEWQKTVGGKVPHLIRVGEGELFAMAGLWETWRDPAGEEVRSYTIVTCAANETVAPVHTRMPVILRREDEDIWLDPETPAEVLQTLLRPFDAAPMEAFPVSPRVNRPDQDDPGVIEPVRPGSG